MRAELTVGTGAGPMVGEFVGALVDGMAGDAASTAGEVVVGFAVAAGEGENAAPNRGAEAPPPQPLSKQESATTPNARGCIVDPPLQKIECRRGYTSAERMSRAEFSLHFYVNVSHRDTWNSSELPCA